MGANGSKGLSCSDRSRTGRSRSSCAASRKIRAIRWFDAQGELVLLRHSKPIGSFPSARKPPIFQKIRLAIRSKAAKQPIGARWENSRCRRMVKAAAARMTAQRTKPAARVAGIATRIAVDISNAPVNSAPPRRIPPSNKVAPRRRYRDRIEQTCTREGSGKQPNKYHVHGLSDRQCISAQLVDDRCPRRIPAEFTLRLLARDDLIGDDRIGEAPEDLARLVKRPSRYSAPGTA